MDSQAEVQIRNHLAAGNWLEAVKLCQQAISIYPDRAEMYYFWGTSLSGLQQTEAAIAVYLQGASLFAQQQRPKDAIACFAVALHLDLDHSPAWNQLAKLLSQLESTLPQQAELLVTTGNRFCCQDQPALGITCFELALKVEPECVNAYFNLGVTFRQQGKIEQAIAYYQSGLSLNPQVAEAHYSLANAQWDHNDLEAAAYSYGQAIALQPHFLAAHTQLCQLLFYLDKKAARAAALHYAQLFGEQKPISSTSGLISTHLMAGLHQEAQQKFWDLTKWLDQQDFDDLAIAELKNLFEGLLFYVPFLSDTPQQNTKFFRRVSQAYLTQIVQPQAQVFPQTAPAQPKSGRPLRIGILSANFRRHSVGWCSADFVQALAQITPELYIYATKPGIEDDQTQKFRAVAKEFHTFDRFASQHEPALMSKTAIAIGQQMQQDQLDVLLELDSIMTPVHAQVLYQRPAKVCTSWPGFEAPFVCAQNHFLCDWQTHPPGVESYYVEQLVRLPHAHMALNGFSAAPVDRASERASLGLSPHQVAYLSASPGQKLNPETIAATMQILQQVPQSVLLRKGAGDLAMIQSLFLQAADYYKIDRDRLLFLPLTQTEEEHRSLYAIADISLDSYPYNGGTHNLEALWFQLPVVTFKGQQSFARMGYSFLHTLGIKVGIAESWEEYVSWAVKLGLDRDLRQQVQWDLARTQLPEQRSPLWNPTLFAQNLYAIFQRLGDF